MILLWGTPGDGPLDAVQSCLMRLGADYRLFDQRSAARSNATAQIDGGHLRLVIQGSRKGDRLDLDEVGAAYLRPVETERAVAEGRFEEDASAQVRAEIVDRAMILWADLAATLVVNPPAAMAVNNAKPYQLQQIAGYGFAVPETLVTTSPEAVRTFHERHGQVIYKSVSGVRSIVSILREDAQERIEKVANGPTQFQEYVPGCDVRVHVVGNEVFATEIRSSATDYRYASLSSDALAMMEVEIPAELADRCRAMAAGMGLAVAGIDLRHTPDDLWVCFEVNPSPAFVFYEEATGQPIGDAIARLLIHADEKGQHCRQGRPAVAA